MCNYIADFVDILLTYGQRLHGAHNKRFKNTHPHLFKSLGLFIRRVFLISYKLGLATFRILFYKRLCSIPASHYCDKPLTIYFRIKQSLNFILLCSDLFIILLNVNKIGKI
ncbi:hypothetical protein BpHYR1_048766 [Brachionus plicatilis]|uniref:Uncharacterized protein n=1 Tax=Brachionus plicatilis TaxID=10195 RepID=A0A3M7QB14_BRAPC|nr:hypothetical protein BpHYR1_048766 [Brachionus plicatilis]